MAIDSYRFLDFATQQIIKTWVGREAREGRPIPWAPMTKPLAGCTIALATTAGVACRDDEPFDQDGERANPWWGDPTYRTIPQSATEHDVALHHLHIDRTFGEQELDVALPMRRLAELASQGIVGRPADRHCSIMGYQLRTGPLERDTAPAIARAMRAERVDAAALVPA
jgi:D-proline reductase (dithiol) PrdB